MFLAQRDTYCYTLRPHFLSPTSSLPLDTVSQYIASIDFDRSTVPWTFSCCEVISKRCTNVTILIVLFLSFLVFSLRFYVSVLLKSLSLADRSWTHYTVLHKPPTFPELTTRRLNPISLVPQNFGTFFWQISQYIIMIIPLSFS